MQDVETEAHREAARIRYAGGTLPGRQEASHEDGDYAAAAASPWLASAAASALPSMEVPDDGECAAVKIPALEFPAVSYPADGRRADRWVLACGGIAAAAAFAVAFVASGGTSAHPGPTATTPAVISQACASVAP
jgi:hypothetical protein